jgi:hypothetical protein
MGTKVVQRWVSYWIGENNWETLVARGGEGDGDRAKIWTMVEDPKGWQNSGEASQYEKDQAREIYSTAVLLFLTGCIAERAVTRGIHYSSSLGSLRAAIHRGGVSLDESRPKTEHGMILWLARRIRRREDTTRGMVYAGDVESLHMEAPEAVAIIDTCCAKVRSRLNNAKQSSARVAAEL